MSMPKTGQNPAKDFITLPSWLRQEIPDKAALGQLSFFRRKGINTVCQQAKCPNWSECFKEGQATFLILGDVCSRSCSFCNIKKEGRPESSLQDEPARVREAVKKLGLKYVVITSVTRDDLEDGGSWVFARTIEEIRRLSGEIRIEVLIPDFAGNSRALKTVVQSKPEVIGHNLETVPRLYPSVRPQADYKRSLRVLGSIKELNSGIITKSSLLLGMGERDEEVVAIMRGLSLVGCDVLALGQYLAPSKKHHPVYEYVDPARFSYYRDIALSLGFKSVASAPFVRSSYRAREIFNEARSYV
jgi:lipoic acid synthetase